MYGHFHLDKCPPIIIPVCRQVSFLSNSYIWTLCHKFLMFEFLKNTFRKNSKPSTGYVILKAVLRQNQPFIPIICKIIIFGVTVCWCIIHNWMKSIFTSFFITIGVHRINWDPDGFAIYRSTNMLNIVHFFFKNFDCCIVTPRFISCLLPLFGQKRRILFLQIFFKMFWLFKKYLLNKF